MPPLTAAKAASTASVRSAAATTPLALAIGCREPPSWKPAGETEKRPPGVSKPTPGSRSFGRAVARPPLGCPDTGGAEVFGRRRGLTLEIAAVAPAAVFFAVVVGDVRTAAWRVLGWSVVVAVFAAGRAGGFEGAFAARALRAGCLAGVGTDFAGV
ncbi:MAG: hypothetical protein QOH13_1756 [Thermoleophilaceae bacterium]|nr:hypothetical protein [Thermoleophilaceae bacterium]